MNKAMSRVFLRVLFVSIAVLCASPAVSGAAEPQPAHGIAMHGEPRYAADFSHFD